MIELNLVEKYLLHKAKSLSNISLPILNNKQWLGFLFDGSKVASFKKQMSAKQSINPINAGFESFGN